MLYHLGGSRGSGYNRWVSAMVVAFLVRDSLSVTDELARSSDELNEMWQPLPEPPVIQSLIVVSREPNVSWNPLPSAVSQITAKHPSVSADSVPVRGRTPVTNETDGGQHSQESSITTPEPRSRRLGVVTIKDKISQWVTEAASSIASVKPMQSFIPRASAVYCSPRAALLSVAILTCLMLSAVCFMMPAQAGQHHRNPPRWEPGLETSLPFRTWLQDLLLWTITTDLEPHRQAAAIISQLGGAARDLARTLTPQEIFNGGMVNGQQLDPVSFLIHGLSERFSPLDDEIRIRAAQDLLHFGRKGNEPVDVLIARFETIRGRARAERGWCEHQHGVSSTDLVESSGSDFGAVSEVDTTIWPSSPKH